MRFRYPILLAALLHCVAGVSAGATFSVNLQLTSQSWKRGGYLTAPFDFGTAFSQIDSMKLEFVMPHGYRGSYNGSTLRQLNIVPQSEFGVPGTGSEPDVFWGPDLSIVPAASDAGPFFKTVVDTVPAQSLTTANFDASQFYGTVFLNTPYDHWPAYLRAGHGWLSLVDETVEHVPNQFNPKISWQAPEVSFARLTITGTVVPEPISLVPFCIGMALILRLKNRPRA